MITAVIVGAGHRSLVYAKLADRCPEQFQIVGVVDPNPFRRQLIVDQYRVKTEHCFASVEELAQCGRIADCAINGTMDQFHVATTIPLLEAGYDVLLEKPLAVSLEELRRLTVAARRTGRKVMTCHVLRYAGFYLEIKKRVAAGEIGELVSLQTVEHVSYHHFSNSYVRGKWGKKANCGGASVLLAKCSHDLDLLTWFMEGVAPRSVDSSGGLYFFNAAHAPKNSGTHCLLDCPLVDTCDYSTKRLNLAHPFRWADYIWPDLYLDPQRFTPENREKALLDPHNPYSRCVWKCDNDQPDRQSVLIEFANGAVATHSMIGGATRAVRKIHLLGTDGEIEGCFEDNQFVIRHRDLEGDFTPGHEYTEEIVKITDADEGAHGGGDLRLARDFLDYVSGKAPSISCTSLEHSLYGHEIVFAADAAMARRQRVELTEFTV